MLCKPSNSTAIISYLSGSWKIKVSHPYIRIWTSTPSYKFLALQSSPLSDQTSRFQLKQIIPEALGKLALSQLGILVLQIDFLKNYKWPEEFRWHILTNYLTTIHSNLKSVQAIFVILRYQTLRPTTSICIER